jgi:tetratricopeptide (TPR) repeat protein
MLIEKGADVSDPAVLYAEQGKTKEAGEMYLRALKGKGEASGPKHTSTLDTVNNLGVLYKNQGKMKGAEEMYLRALQGYEEVWGPKHTSTLNTVNNLGLLYADQGKTKEAEEMYLRALKGFEEALGPNHMSTLDTVYVLGSLYRYQGDVTKAKEIYQRAVNRYGDVGADREAHYHQRCPQPSKLAIETRAWPDGPPQPVSLPLRCSLAAYVTSVLCLCLLSSRPGGTARCPVI